MTVNEVTEEAPGVLRRTVLLGLFVGTGVGAGYLLAGVPNCELITLVSALAGSVLGPRRGFVAGALAEGLFSLGNPLGPAPPPLLAAQVLGLGLAGWLGGVTAGAVAARWRGGRRRCAALLALGTGVGTTLFYDVLTSLAGALAFGVDARLALAGAVPFSLVHVTVNGAQFLLLFPMLVARYHHLARPPLRGVGPPLAAALLVLLAGPAVPRAQAPADSAITAATTDTADTTDAAIAASAETDTLGAVAPGPVAPFTATLVERLERETFWTVMTEGGLGARLVLAHEWDSAPWPLLRRDGVPVGGGHRWTDDPGLVAQTGCELGTIGYGCDALGGTAGEVDLMPADPRPADAVLETRFFKGSHATYLRSLAFRTPRAPWRARFDFEESLDREGYGLLGAGDAVGDLTSPTCAAACRAGRAVIERTLPDSSRIALSVETVRRYRDLLPTTLTEHEETWVQRAALTWRGHSDLGELRGALFVTSADVQREWPATDLGWRKLEVTREGASLAVTDRAGRRWLAATVLGWRLHDTGADEGWALAWGGPVGGSGDEIVSEAGLRVRWRGLETTPTARLAGSRPGGWRPGGALRVRPAARDGWWALDLETGGRAPRSDELLTAERAAAPGTVVLLAPNPDLRGERVWRAALTVRRLVAGTELAVTGSARALRGGIAWTPVAAFPGAGRWANTLDLDARTVTASATRRLRLAGALRLRALGVWRECDLRSGVARGWPPARAASLAVDWERVAFHGDGVFEIGYRWERVGVYADPWLPIGGYLVPARTLQQLLLGFRLLGAELSLDVHNLAGLRTPLSADTHTDGRELRWRLAWTFVR